MYLISTSQKTILSDFADLETKSTFVHANGGSTDFQFNAQRRVFVEVDKNAGLVVMRIREKQNAPEIQRVRKLLIDNAFSVACGKTTLNQIAIGQSSGFVRQYDFRTAEQIHRYPADQTRGTVLYLDYNSTDEYIAAVLDCGKINVYGTKTKLKIDTINIDDHASLARFHPSKRFHLSITSFMGAVSIYDLQSKRTIFNISDAHDAPCRDVSMCSTQPSLLVSVGYDCKINIFDIRRNKAQSATGRLVYTHPLSTVALSDCGTYFCVGNLKGELITYDMRSTKAPLTVKPVHEGCAVTRVAFVPAPTDEQQSSSFGSGNNATADSGRVSQVEQLSSEELRKSIAANLLNTQQQLASMSSLGYATPASAGILATPAAVRQQRDSFCDFLDAPRLRGVDRMSTRLTTTRRDSFDWDALHCKPNVEELRQHMAPAVSGPSSLESTAESLQQTLSGPLRDRSNVSTEAKLKQIAETDEHSQHDQSANCSAASSNAGSDKENPPIAEVEQNHRLRLLSASRNSTPHPVSATAQQSTNLQLQPQKLLRATSSGLSAAATQQEVMGDVRKELTEMRSSIEGRLDQLENELKWTNEKNKFSTFVQLGKYWKQQVNNTREIRDALGLLLRTDRFMHEFSNMQHENQILKEQVKKLRTKLADYEPREDA